MMDDKKKLLRNVKLIIWGIVISVIAFQFLPEDYFGFLKIGDNKIQYLIATPILLMTLWMILAFGIHLVSNAGRSKRVSDILFEIKKPLFITTICLVIVLIITAAGYYFIFNNNSFPEKFHFKNIDQLVIGVLLIVFTIVHFLLLYILLRLWRNPSFFIITKTGFLYESGGISPGFILWEDIAAIDERQLFYNPGYRVYSAPSSNFLVIELKDPDKYNFRYNLLLRLTVVLMAKLIKFQTGRSGDIVIKPSDFGSKYEEVKALVKKNVEEYEASISA